MPRRRQRRPAPDSTSRALRLPLAIAAVILLSVAVFLPVSGFEFVDYDDPTFVTEHPIVRQGLTASGVAWVLPPVNGYSAAGGPLTFLSHMLDVELFGMRPGAHHLVNLVLHTANGVLLLIVLWRMTGDTGRSACVAALFAIHPLHVESVAWVSERKDVLSTLFWLLTTLAYVRYARSPGRSRFAVVCVLFSLGLMAKPVLVTLPLVLLFLDVWPLKRVSFERANRWRWRSVLIEKIPLAAISLAAMAFILQAQQAIGAVSAVSAIPWPLRFENVLVSYATYLLKTIWPAALAVFYPYPPAIPIWKTVLSALTVAGLSVMAWRCRIRQPAVTVGWFWYLITLVPMIGLIQVGSHSMADRFTYVPLIGVFIAVVWGGAAVFGSGQRSRLALAAIACVAIVGCAVAARLQLAVWRNSETLWTHALTATTANFRAYAGLAEVAARKGDKTRAIEYYKEAVRLAPDAVEWHVNLGLLFSEIGDLAGATSSFERALALRPDDPETENNLGAMFSRLGRPADAIRHFERAVALRPAYALARRNLGLAHAMSGDTTSGVRELLDALKFSPNEGQWHYEVAVILLRANRVAEGVSHLREAVRLAPDHQAAKALLAQIGG